MSKIYNYISVEESESVNFLRFPKMLFADEFNKLSMEARVLYSMMLERSGLSKKNGWYDDRGYVYIIYKYDDIEEDFNCGRQKVATMIKELIEFGLLESQRQGFNKPNLLFVKSLYTASDMSDNDEIMNSSQEVRKSNFREFENQTTSSLKIKPPVVRKSNYHNIVLNKTDISKTESIYLSENVMDRWNETLMDLYRQINYSEISLIGHDDNHREFLHEALDEFIDLMVEVLLMDDEELVSVKGKLMPAKLVKVRIRKIDFRAMSMMMDSFSKINSVIQNKKGYMLTMIYNASTTAKISIDSYTKEVLNQSDNEEDI